MTQKIIAMIWYNSLCFEYVQFKDRIAHLSTLWSISFPRLLSNKSHTALNIVTKDKK